MTKKRPKRVKAKKRVKPKLKDLLDKITPENRHPLVWEVEFEIPLDEE